MTSSLSKSLYFDLRSGILFKTGPNKVKFRVETMDSLDEEELESVLAYFDLYSTNHLIDFLGLERTIE